MTQSQLLNHLLKENKTSKTKSVDNQNQNKKGLDLTALVFLQSLKTNQNHRRRKKIFESYYQFQQIY